MIKMNIEKAKALCLEHDRLGEIVESINKAIENNQWVKIKTPRDEIYMSNIQIKSVYDLAKSRMIEIEKELKR